MTLDDTQKAAVAEWVKAGASLSEVQKRIREDFGVALTFMDTRFLVDDLKLTLQDPEEEKPGEDAATEVLPPELDTEPVATGSVSVTMDQITKPQALVSGKVTFSDGNRAEWLLDQMGRLSLNPDTAGYRPSEQDVLKFQMELQRLAQTQGF